MYVIVCVRIYSCVYACVCVIYYLIHTVLELICTHTPRHYTPHSCIYIHTHTPLTYSYTGRLEMKLGLEVAGLHLSTQNFEKLYNKVDADKDTSGIDFSEFLKFMLDVRDQMIDAGNNNNTTTDNNNLQNTTNTTTNYNTHDNNNNTNHNTNHNSNSNTNSNRSNNHIHIRIKQRTQFVKHLEEEQKRLDNLKNPKQKKFFSTITGRDSRNRKRRATKVVPIVNDNESSVVEDDEEGGEGGDVEEEVGAYLYSEQQAQPQQQGSSKKRARAAAYEAQEQQSVNGVSSSSKRQMSLIAPDQRFQRTDSLSVSNHSSVHSDDSYASDASIATDAPHAPISEGITSKDADSPSVASQPDEVSTRQERAQMIVDALLQEDGRLIYPLHHSLSSHQQSMSRLGTPSMTPRDRVFAGLAPSSDGNDSSIRSVLSILSGFRNSNTNSNVSSRAASPRIAGNQRGFSNQSSYDEVIALNQESSLISQGQLTAQRVPSESILGSFTLAQKKQELFRRPSLESLGISQSRLRDSLSGRESLSGHDILTPLLSLGHMYTSEYPLLATITERESRKDTVLERDSHTDKSSSRDHSQFDALISGKHMRDNASSGNLLDSGRSSIDHHSNKHHSLALHHHTHHHTHGALSPQFPSPRAITAMRPSAPSSSPLYHRLDPSDTASRELTQPHLPTTTIRPSAPPSSESPYHSNIEASKVAARTWSRQRSRRYEVTDDNKDDDTYVNTIQLFSPDHNDSSSSKKMTIIEMKDQDNSNFNINYDDTTFSTLLHPYNHPSGTDDFQSIPVTLVPVEGMFPDDLHDTTTTTADLTPSNPIVNYSGDGHMNLMSIKLSPLTRNPKSIEAFAQLSS